MHINLQDRDAEENDRLIYYSHRPDFRVKTIIEIGTL
jgi:hypothetical protein